MRRTWMKRPEERAYRCFCHNMKSTLDPDCFNDKRMDVRIMNSSEAIILPPPGLISVSLALPVSWITLRPEEHRKL